MRKIIIYINIFILIIFILPIIFTNKRSISSISKEFDKKNQNVEVENYDYSKYGKIKLLHKKDNKIDEVNLDEYIACVVSAEMPVIYDLEALKAQAIVARTYTIYKISISPKHKNADICDDSTCCQAWISKDDRMKKWKSELAQDNWNKILEAVNATKGKIVTYDNKPINAFFHSNSGGKTEIPLYVWGGNNYPYLKVVETSGEENYSQYKSEAEFSKKELEKKIKEKHRNFKIDFNKKDCIKIVKRDDSNRIVTVKFGNLELSGVEIRTLLGLRSSNFTVSIKDDKVKFTVIGYGHGVGMSQTGADSLAKQGKKYDEIIKHFYKNVDIVDI